PTEACECPAADVAGFAHLRSRSAMQPIAPAPPPSVKGSPRLAACQLKEYASCAPGPQLGGEKPPRVAQEEHPRIVAQEIAERSEGLDVGVAGPRLVGEAPDSRAAKRCHRQFPVFRCRRRRQARFVEEAAPLVEEHLRVALARPIS